MTRLCTLAATSKIVTVLAALASIGITASAAKNIYSSNRIQQIDKKNETKIKSNGNRLVSGKNPEAQFKKPAGWALNDAIQNSQGLREAPLKIRAQDESLSCTSMIRNGESYAGFTEAKQAWERAKEEHGLTSKATALQCLVNAISFGIEGWEENIDILATTKDIDRFLAQARRAKDQEMIYSFEYLKGQLLLAAYARNGDQLIRVEALGSIKNAAQAAELAKDKGYKLIAQMATTYFYQPGIKSRDNIEIRKSIETALASWKSLPRPHQAKPFYYSAKISEKEKKYDKALGELKRALDLSVTNAERALILTNILRIKTLTHKYSDADAKKAAIKLRSIYRNILWKQLIALEFEAREQLLKDPRWQIALLPGEHSPSMDFLLWYELNMRGLALEAEKSITHGHLSQAARTPPAELSIQDIQNSLSEGELLLVLGEIQAKFDDRTYPYKRKTKNKAEEDFANLTLRTTTKNYYAAQVSRSKYSFKWNGMKEYADQIAANFIRNLEENTSDSTELFKKVSHRLHTSLGIDPSYQTIYIVPYGAYSNIPLSAMLESSMDIKMPRHAKIRILSNARELIEIKRNKDSFESHSMAIFGDPDLSSLGGSASERSGDSGSWAKLPYSKIEALGIKHQTAHSSLFTGKDFTIEALDKSLTKYTLLHLATHAFYGAKTYDNSEINSEWAGIVFSGANRHTDKYINQSILSPNAIARMPFDKVSLISISGCNSGRSKSVALEIWSGLQRAFLAAGAKSTLSALWKVDDKATAEFMIRFYKYLKTGIDRSEALAATRRDFQKGIPSHTEEWKAPYYWAAWQLVGDWRPIKGL